MNTLRRCAPIAYLHAGVAAPTFAADVRCRGAWVAPTARARPEARGTRFLAHPRGGAAPRSVLIAGLEARFRDLLQEHPPWPPSALFARCAPLPPAPSGWPRRRTTS